MEEYTPTEELKTIIEPACDKAREGMLNTPKNQRGYYYVGPSTEEDYSKIVRLRLDWELSADAVKEGGGPLEDQTLRLMYTQVATDLDDLLQNGDRDQYADPMLSATDGSRKRGKKLVGLDIVEQNLVVVFVTRKDSYEYTLYLNIVPEWSE